MRWKFVPIIALLVRLSLQNAAYTHYSGGFDCYRREFCSYGDVVCDSRKFTPGEQYNVLLRCAPQQKTRYSVFRKWAFANIPLVQLLHRFINALIVCHS